MLPLTFVTFQLFLLNSISACDLEIFFHEKEVSIEEAASSSSIVFQALSLPITETTTFNTIEYDGKFTVRFELLNIFKDVQEFKEQLGIFSNSDKRELNVTIMENPIPECKSPITIPQKFIVFGKADEGKVFATSVTKWNEWKEQRIWSALGWSSWGEWSPCSETCSSGIQQRSRQCLIKNCPGHNIEQRHCNMFRCEKTINPLILEDVHFFHPSKEKWRSPPDRTSAWRLEPYTYLWVPSVFLLTSLKIAEFPKQFSLFFTVRLNRESSGTIFSLRSRSLQDTYLSIDLRQTDLKLAHAAQNISDTLVIPMDLDDQHWHRIAISIRDGKTVDCYLDCEWKVTEIMKSTIFNLPGDLDLIVGYLFTGDIEEVTVVVEPTLANLSCDTTRIPIIDNNMEIT